MTNRLFSAAPAVAGLAVAGAGGYAAAKGDVFPLAFVGSACLVGAIAARARTLILAAASLSLIMGSTVAPELRISVFYLRFLMLGAFAAVSLLERPVREVGGLSGLTRPLAAVGLLAAASVFWSVDSALTAQRALALGLMISAVLAVALRVWRTEQEIMRDVSMVASVFGFALVVGLAGFVQSADWAMVAGRFRGIVENPNTIGIMGGLMLPVVVAFAIVRRRLTRVWWLMVTATTIISLLLSQSRGGLVSGGVGLLILMILRRGSKHALAAAVTVSIVAVWLSLASPSDVPAPPLLQSIDLRFRQDQTASGRLEAWNLAIELAREKPVAGWGFGVTEEVFGQKAVAIRGFQGGLVHNSYLQSVLELGPAALILLLLAIGAILRRGWPGGRADPLQAGLYGAVVAGSTNAVVESSMLAPGSVFAFAFWLFAAACLQVASLRQSASRIAASPPNSRGLGV